MKITCNIIENLLSLYVDDLVSEDSITLVEEHLQTCTKCQDYLEKLKKENYTKDYGTWLNDKELEKPKSKSYSNTIRLTIDEILKTKPKTFDDFLKQLESSGYEVKQSKNGKNVGLKGKGEKNLSILIHFEKIILHQNS